MYPGGCREPGPFQERRSVQKRRWYLCGSLPLEPDLGESGSDDSQLLRCRQGEIDDPVAACRTPIVDGYLDGFTVFDIGYLYQSPEREFPMGGGKRMRIENFPIGSALAVKSVAVTIERR